MTATVPDASGVTLPNAVTPEARTRRHIDLAQEVSDLLGAALARDDERRGIRCPHCGQRRSDKALS